MIHNNEVYHIGYIQKFRGLQGEVELQFTDDPFDRGSAEYLVLKIDEILVPFFLENYRFKNNDTAILKFEDIDNDVKAKKLVGLQVYYPLEHLNDEEDQELSSLKALTGFTLYDESFGEVGIINMVDDSSYNTLFYVNHPKKGELVLPYHDDFLVDCNIANRTITLALPQGIIDLNE
ncbi:MAG: 16S rRNA processing protein RimM [Bacteroidaceae bacterium]|nr:16S rRNA processing protein RimM [Bacteroidaceae bacterium]